MSKSGISLPRTRAALERLAQSVTRLEGVQALHEDADASLAAELAAAQAEHAALQQVVATVSDRLDGAISRLEAALED